MRTLEESEIKELLNQSIFSSMFMLDHPIKKYETLLKDIYKNNNIDRTPLIEKYGPYQESKGNIEDYKKILVGILKNKIELWSDDFWSIYSINNRNANKQYELEADSKKLFPFKFLKKYKNEGLLSAYNKYVENKSNYYFSEIDFWYSINKKNKRNNIDDFILNYPQDMEWKILNKVKLLSLYTEEKAFTLINEIMDSIKGSSVYQEAKEELKSSGILIAENTEKAKMTDENLKVRYEKTIYINPLYFIENYGLTVAESKDFIQTFYMILKNNSEIMKLSIKENVNNSNFKNYESYAISYHLMYPHEGKENDKELVENYALKINNLLKIASELMLDKNSEYYLLGPKTKKEFKEQDGFIKLYMQVLEKFVDYSIMQYALKLMPKNDDKKSTKVKI